MKIKKLLSVSLLSIMLSATFFGCAQDSGSSTTSTTSQGASAPSEIYIPLISKGFQHQFWQAVKLGSENAGKDLGVKINFVGPESETEVQKQIDMFTAELGKNPQAVCFAALDTKAATNLLQQCKDKGIPVVGFDSGVDSDIPVSTVATDSKNAAAAAADKMAEAIGKKGNIAIVSHSDTSKTGIDRRDGFKERIESEYPDIKIVAIQNGDGDHQKSADIAKTIIAQNPDIKGIFGTNEGSAVGAYNGTKEAGMLGKIVLIGFDSSKTLKDGVRSGEIYGAISQDPVGMGYKAVETAYKAYKGEKVESFVDTGYKWYDKTNVDSEEMKPLLYD